MIDYLSTLCHDIHQQIDDIATLDTVGDWSDYFTTDGRMADIHATYTTHTLVNLVENIYKDKVSSNILIPYDVFPNPNGGYSVVWHGTSGRIEVEVEPGISWKFNYLIVRKAVDGKLIYEEQHGLGMSTTVGYISSVLTNGTYLGYTAP